MATSHKSSVVHAQNVSPIAKGEQFQLSTFSLAVMGLTFLVGFIFCLKKFIDIEEDK